MEVNSQEILEVSEETGRNPEQIRKWYLLYKTYCNSTKKSNICAFVKKMKDFREFVVWVQKRIDIANETHKAKKSLGLQVALPAKHTDDVSEVVSALTSLNDNDSFVPSTQVFYKFALLQQAFPIDQLRSTHFSHVPIDVWSKFMKMFFTFYHSNPEQVAMDLRSIRERSQTALRNQINKLTDLQDKEDDAGKILEYAKVIGTLSNQLSGISSQFAKDLASLNLVGSRIKGGVNIQIINKIPRPHLHKKPMDIKTIETDVKVLEDLTDV